MTEPDWHIRSLAVCNLCEALHPKTDSIVLAISFGSSDGLKVPLGTQRLNEGDTIHCLQCGAEFEVRKGWPRNLETGQPAVSIEYALLSNWAEW